MTSAPEPAPRVHRALLPFFITLLATACATQTTTPGDTSPQDPSTSLPALESPDEESLWQQRVSVLGTWLEWRVRGKVAYQLPEDAGSASLHWHQAGDLSTLRLSGPLGAASTRLTNEGALLRVRRDGIERLYPADAAPWLPGGRLLPVPMDSIHYWLRGIPDPHLPIDDVEHKNATALVISQAGWVIRYLDYRNHKGTDMPSRLELKSPESDLKLTVILRAWELTAVD